MLGIAFLTNNRNAQEAPGYDFPDCSPMSWFNGIHDMGPELRNLKTEMKGFKNGRLDKKVPL